MPAPPIPCGQAIRPVTASSSNRKKTSSLNPWPPSIVSRSSNSEEGLLEAQAYLQVRAGSVEKSLFGHTRSEALTRKALARLKSLGQEPQTSGMTLSQISEAFRIAEPETLRDPAFALQCSLRAAQAAGGHSPTRLFELADAYRAAGQIEKSRATTKEALALQTPIPPSSQKQ